MFGVLGLSFDFAQPFDFAQGGEPVEPGGEPVEPDPEFIEWLAASSPASERNLSEAYPYLAPYGTSKDTLFADHPRTGVRSIREGG